MNVFVRPLLATLLLLQVSMASPQQETANKQARSSAILNPVRTLDDGTPVTLRISQTVSSADAHVNDRVEFEVIDEVRVADTLIIPKGGIAWGTVTEAQHKRRLGRGGKLEIVMNSVKLADEETAPLRATKEAQEGWSPGQCELPELLRRDLYSGPWRQLFCLSMARTLRLQRGRKFQRSSMATSRWIWRNSGLPLQCRQPVRLMPPRAPMSRLHRIRQERTLK